MTFITLENFDELFTGNPEDIEKNLSALLPKAQALENKSIYLQILSQIALAQAMQKKFDLAHKTLDTAEALLTQEDKLAQVRILLERGRVFHQANNIEAALPLFKKSYEISKSSGFDFHTINAAHMIPMVVNTTNEKIYWNKVALDLAERTNDKRARAWLGALYNNIAQNYIENGKYKEALDAFGQCKIHAEEKGDAIVVRGAKWGIARSLRSLGSLDDALEIQAALLKEYNSLSESGELPIELIRVARGMVYEELAEIYYESLKKYALLAYDSLSEDSWCVRLISERIDRMKHFSEIEVPSALGRSHDRN